MTSFLEFIDGIIRFGHRIGEHFFLIVFLAALLVAIFILKKLLQKFKSTGVDMEIEPGFDLDSLTASAPPSRGPVMELYNIPVRLSGLVLAPAGKSTELPPSEEFEHFYESLIPGFSDIADAHSPTIRRWPAQVSVSGFSSKVFRYRPTPKDTYTEEDNHWAAVAGTFKYRKRSFLAGLILYTQRPITQSQKTIENSEEWLDIFRIKQNTPE